MKSKGRARGPSNVGAEEGNEGDFERNVTEVGKCNDPFPAPELAYIMCPKECPLLRFDPDLLCHWRCISEEKCHSYPGVVERETGYCRVCAVPGCRLCVSDRQECRECHEGFELKKGHCVAHAKMTWTILLVVIGVICLLLLVYIVHLAWRPIVSPDALEWGMENRSRQKARKDHGDHALYDLNLSLADVVTSAGGIGATLHFSWQRMTLVWSAAITLACMGVTMYHGRLNASEIAEMSPMHDEAEGICTDRLEALAQNHFEAMRIHFLWLTGIIYMGSSLGAILWAWWQRRKYQTHEDRTTTMQDYAVLCEGFPVEVSAITGGPKIEEEYIDFLRSSWGSSVIGVSISWNFDNLEDEITASVSGIVQDLMHQHKTEHGPLDDGQAQGQDQAQDQAQAETRMDSSITTPPFSQRSPTPSHRSRSRAECCCRPMMEAVDGAFFGEVPPCMHKEEEEGRNPSKELGRDPRAQAMKLLSAIPTTGFCFVVFATERDMRRCLGIPLGKFRGEHEITVKHANGEAETVLWDGFSTSRAQLRWNQAMGVVQILGVIAGWTLCFWAPYTIYILSWQKTGGASQGDAEVGMVVGLLITVGNQIVYAVCGLISEKAKFTSRDARDTYYTGLYTFAVLVNTVLDMWLITVMARGWQRDAAADPDSLIRDPSMQHALFVQLILYLWPCTLLLPFLLEPFVLNIGPYFLAKWLVRSRPNCTMQEAEDCLALPPFDLNRYGDNLINIMMVVLFFLLTAVTLWWMFFMLTISLLVIYAWDCYRFKRATMRTHFATEEIDVLSQYVMAIPCALLAGGFTFKALGGQGLVATWDADSFLNDHPHTWSTVGVAFTVHLVIHWMVLAFVVPRLLPEPASEELDPPICGEAGCKMEITETNAVFVCESCGVQSKEESSAGLATQSHWVCAGCEFHICTKCHPSCPRDQIPYEQTASLICCNWFNANPVHVIRSRFLHCYDPSHVFYQPGREFLHKRNCRPEDKNALIIYECEAYKLEGSFLMDLKMASSSAFTEARRTLKTRATRIGFRKASAPIGTLMEHDAPESGRSRVD